MANWMPEKAKEIIRSLLRQAESETALENHGAAELFSNKAKTIANQYGIDIESIDTAFISDVQVLNELGITTVANIFNRSNARSNLRKIWFEELASVVAESYNCKTSPNFRDGSINIYGYDLDRELATFMFVKLAEVADEVCERERKIAKSNIGTPPVVKFGQKQAAFVPASDWMGNDVWIDNFHLGFREEIQKSFQSNRQQDTEKLAKVEEFSKKNPANDYYDYWRYRQNLHASESNEQAYKTGQICGYNIAHKATSAPTALVAKKSSITKEDTVWILIDKSASMSWGYGFNKMQQAKDGALEYARVALNKGYSVGVIAFSTGCNLVSNPTKSINDKFVEDVNKLHPSGGTDLTAALRLAQSKFLNKEVKRAIMVITDGMPDDDRSALLAANDCKRLGIEIMAIGTEDVNQEFIDKLTSKTGFGMLVSGERLALAAGSMAEKLA